MPFLCNSFQSNCIFCAYHYLFFFMSISGFANISYSCRHNCNKTIFKIQSSKTKTVLSILCALVVCYRFIYICEETMGKHFDRFYPVTNLTFVFRSFVILILCSLNTNSRIKSIEGLEYILENNKTSNLRQLLTKRYIGYFRTDCKFYIALCMSVLVYQVYFISQIYHLTQQVQIDRSLMSAWCFYIDLVIIFLFWMESTTYGEILNKIAKEIKLTMNNDQEKNIELKLVQIRRCYLAIIKNFKLFNKSLNPMMSVWLLLSTLMLVFNIYISYNIIKVDREACLADVYFLVLQFRNNSTNFLVCRIVLLMEKLKQPVRKWRIY